MANVTVKDVPDEDLRAITVRARAEGMSTQSYLRRLIARDAAVTLAPDQLADLTAKLRAGRTPMTMEEFDVVRRRSPRS